MNDNNGNSNSNHSNSNNEAESRGGVLDEEASLQKKALRLTMAA